MVPKRHVDGVESFALVQAQRGNVSPGRDDGRAGHACRGKRVCRAAEKVTADALVSISCVHGKQADAGKATGRVGLGIGRFQVERHVSDRRIVPLGDKYLIRYSGQFVDAKFYGLAEPPSRYQVAKNTWVQIAESSSGLPLNVQVHRLPAGMPALTPDR